jgi:hypothetical protein
MRSIFSIEGRVARARKSGLLRVRRTGIIEAMRRRLPNERQRTLLPGESWHTMI